MHKLKYLFCTLFVVPIMCTHLSAQTPSDAIMMNAEQACILLEYNYGSFDQYWEGSYLRENQTIATVRRNTVMSMMAVGILDKLNFFIGVPYIKTESSDPNGGKFAGASGFQDLSLALKYQIINKEKEKGTFSALATVGFSTPVSNYLPDYMPYSLGLGAPELSYRAIAQYQWKNGLYLRGAGAFLWRGYARAEREYYYNNGSYYTSLMDVPNAVTFEGVLGLWAFKNALQLEFSYMSSNSTSGDDIRSYNAPQPTNNIDSDRLGLFAHFYVPSVKGLGIVAYHNRVVNGRNAAKINTTGVGLTYYFNYRKKQDKNETY
ncbi:transporter [Flavobacteriaceae bacterium XHP0103]|uniref:transporter n=1 Tax=Marixanthotalea marina TaxID=2844359 RepID=UPI002989BBDF|nr:transporter [Marixanthotalea marina]MBU3821105.1 transporter [Marixanthotalea marina]